MHWLRSGLLLAVCGGTTFGEEPPSTGRILYLAPAQPLVLEVVIIYNGRPLASTLDELLRVEFERLDENGDGRLSVSEQKRLPSQKVLQSVGLIGWDDPSARVATQSPLEDVADVSGLRRKYEELGVTLVRMYDDPTRSTDLGRMLFQHLDRNGNQRLSLAELKEASRSLLKFDRDDDQIVSSLELSGVPIPESMTTALGTFQFFLLPSDVIPDRLVSRCIRAYSRPQRPPTIALPRSEYYLSETILDRVDRDRDGTLTSAEWELFLRSGSADVTITARFGSAEPSQERLTVALQPTLNKTRSVASGNSLVIGPSQLVVSGRSLASSGDSRPKLRIGFQNLDRDSNGYVDYKEAIQAKAQSVFQSFDADDNGQLTLDEYIEGLAPLYELAKCQVEIRVDDSGKDLFSIADTWSDGALTLRELQALSQRLASWDQNGDEEVSSDEFPAVYRFQITHGSLNDPALRATSSGDRQRDRQRRVYRTSSVKWFTAMDRNRDGDVSRREFPGTDEHFRRLDADGDGLIDHAEAEAVGVKP